MEKNKTNAKDTRTKRAANILDTADIVGVSPRQVRRVLDIEQENDNVIKVFMFLKEGKQALVEAARQLVPFN